MILADKRRTGEVTEMKRLYAAGSNLCILEAFPGRFNSQRQQVASSQRPECRFANPGDGHLPHNKIKNSAGDSQESSGRCLEKEFHV